MSNSKSAPEVVDLLDDSDDDDVQVIEPPPPQQLSLLGAAPPPRADHGHRSAVSTCPHAAAAQAPDNRRNILKAVKAPLRKRKRAAEVVSRQESVNNKTLGKKTSVVLAQSQLSFAAKQPPKDQQVEKDSSKRKQPIEQARNKVIMTKNSTAQTFGSPERLKQQTLREHQSGNNRRLHANQDHNEEPSLMDSPSITSAWRGDDSVNEPEPESMSKAHSSSSCEQFSKSIQVPKKRQRDDASLSLLAHVEHNLVSKPQKTGNNTIRVVSDATDEPTRKNSSPEQEETLPLQPHQRSPERTKSKHASASPQNLSRNGKDTLQVSREKRLKRLMRAGALPPTPETESSVQTDSSKKSSTPPAESKRTQQEKDSRQEDRLKNFNDNYESHRVSNVVECIPSANNVLIDKDGNVDASIPGNKFLAEFILEKIASCSTDTESEQVAVDIHCNLTELQISVFSEADDGTWSEMDPVRSIELLKRMLVTQMKQKDEKAASSSNRDDVPATVVLKEKASNEASSRNEDGSATPSMEMAKDSQPHTRSGNTTNQKQSSTANASVSDTKKRHAERCQDQMNASYLKMDHAHWHKGRNATKVKGRDDRRNKKKASRTEANVYTDLILSLDGSLTECDGAYVLNECIRAEQLAFDIASQSERRTIVSKVANELSGRKVRIMQEQGDGSFKELNTIQTRKVLHEHLVDKAISEPLAARREESFLSGVASDDAFDDDSSGLSLSSTSRHSAVDGPVTGRNEKSSYSGKGTSRSTRPGKLIRPTLQEEFQNEQDNTDNGVSPQASPREKDEIKQKYESSVGASVVPIDIDVKIGRDVGLRSWPGNERLNEIVCGRVHEFETATQKQKAILEEDTVLYMLAEGRRFVKTDSRGNWTVASFKEVVNKAHTEFLDVIKYMAATPTAPPPDKRSGTKYLLHTLLQGSKDSPPSTGIFRTGSSKKSKAQTGSSDATTANSTDAHPIFRHALLLGGGQPFAGKPVSMNINRSAEQKAPRQSLKHRQDSLRETELEIETEGACFDVPEDPIFSEDSILRPNELQLLWLGEESMYCTGKPEFQFAFIFFYATASLKVEIRKLDPNGSESDKIRKIVEMDDWQVQARFNSCRAEIRKSLHAGHRRPMMLEVISKMRLYLRAGKADDCPFPHLVPIESISALSHLINAR